MPCQMTCPESRSADGSANLPVLAGLSRKQKRKYPHREHDRATTLRVMGLLDDAKKVLSERAQADASRLKAEESRFVPWSANWTHELASLIAEQGIPLSPVYVGAGGTDWQREVTGRGHDDWIWARTDKIKYWGEAWAVRGWQRDSENDPKPKDFLLKSDGSLWDLYITGKSFVDVVTLDKTGGRGAISQLRHVRYPDVRPAHERIMLVNGDLLAASDSPPGIYPPDIRNVVGVSIAAALERGNAVQNGWIVGAA